MARMLANDRRDRGHIECTYGCCTIRGRYTHSGRKNARFRKLARAADKASWKKADGALYLSGV